MAPAPNQQNEPVGNRKQVSYNSPTLAFIVQNWLLLYFYLQNIMYISLVDSSNQKAHRDGNDGKCNSSLATVDTVQSPHKTQYKTEWPLQTFLFRAFMYSFPSFLLLHLFLL